MGLIGVVLLVLAVLATMAEAHDAPSGWTYPLACCSNKDCREVDDAEISEGPRGYTIRATGEQLRMNDGRVRESPDGRFHWCSVGGRPDSRTICLFVPPRGY